MNLATVVIGTAVCCLALVVAAQYLIARVPYLAYQLGTPFLKPALGWPSVAALALAWVLTLVAAALVAARRAPPRQCRLPRYFCPLAVALSAVHLVYALYMPKSPELERAIVCVDRATGSIEWTSQGMTGPRGTMHSDNSAATPTPVTDGARIFGYFGTVGILCMDTHGKTLWTSKELPFESRQGVASSPILCGGRLVILSESQLGGYLGALDPDTGQLVWKTNRGKPVHSYAGNCRTPSAKVIGGRDTVVVWGYKDLSGYDAQTGQELWTHEVGDFGSANNPVASLVSDERQLYLVGPQKTMAVDRSKLAEPSTPMAWERKTTEGAQCASPVLHNGLLFAISDTGMAYCLDSASGAVLWRQRWGTQHYASPVAVGDRIYFCSTRGLTTVVASDRRYREIAENDLDERTYASFAPADGQLFIRTSQHLYCIREPN